MNEIKVKLRQGFTFGGWLPEIIPQLKNEFQSPSFTNKPHSNNEEYFQFKAFLAGMKYGSIANPNPSVGCVIVKNNKILAMGCTHAWKGIHAEKEAFLQLSNSDLEGAQVYVTLEPCTHIGNQPPCTDLFLNSKIQKAFLSRLDLNPQVTSKGLELLNKIGIDVSIGILKNEVTAWNFPFFIQQKYQRPMVALKWAQSLDGCLADDDFGSQWISGPMARKYTHWLRQKYDVILVGANTFLHDMPSLDVRDIDLEFKRNPLRIVFDPKGKILLCSKNEQNLLKKKSLSKKIKTLFLIDENMLIEVLSSSPDWFFELKTFENIKFLPVRKKSEFYTASNILESLNNQEFVQFLGRPLQSIFVEGGARLLTLFIQDQLFDVAHVFTSPFVIGGHQHKLFSTSQEVFKVTPKRMVSSVERWQIIANERLGNDILLEMTPIGLFESVLS